MQKQTQILPSNLEKNGQHVCPPVHTSVQDLHNSDVPPWCWLLTRKIVSDMFHVRNSATITTLGSRKRQALGWAKSVSEKHQFQNKTEAALFKANRTKSFECCGRDHEELKMSSPASRQDMYARNKIFWTDFVQVLRHLFFDGGKYGDTIPLKATFLAFERTEEFRDNENELHGVQNFVRIQNLSKP